MLLCFLAIGLVIWKPALLFGLGLALFGITGCSATEAGAMPCVVHDVDIGNLLYASGRMSWVLIATIVPIAATSAIGLIWAVVAVALRFRRREQP